MKLNRWKFSGVRFGLLLLCSLLAPTSALRAQENLNDQLRKVLTDPDARKALEKAQNLAPIELFRTQILPNDVLTYVKPNQWAIAAFEIRSNLVDYVGSLETAPLPMEGMPQEVVLHREARLTKGRRTRLTLPVILPRIPKEVGIILRRPESLREDEVFNMPLRLLEPHQMLIPVLTRGANDGYNRLNAMKVMAPLSAAHRDPVMVDRQRYHRFVLPADPELPLLPNHPLAWTAISHVIWDGMEPEKLSIGQQESLIDWIHWGGQLVLVGGAGPSFNPLLESFLAPYLPARPNGRSASAAGADLVDLSRRYYPLAKVQDPEELLEGTQSYVDAWKKFGHRYELEPAPIRV
ncbi:MAG: hypothetical protein SFX72_03960 [Isosphaeraceae bacterium]|nr:hypothetical protein [Isosphaeraceae bacterium]